MLYFNGCYHVDCDDQKAGDSFKAICVFLFFFPNSNVLYVTFLYMYA